jgi:hypothetical protein
VLRAEALPASLGGRRARQGRRRKACRLSL